VVVHGAGPQIGALLQKLGKQSEFIQGMRVTDEETLDVVEMVLGGLINQEIVTLINKAGGKAVGLTGKDGHFIHARKLKVASKEDKKKKIDVGLVGEVVRIDPEIIQLLDSRDFIPVIAPIGSDENGTAYNINADVAAGKLADHAAGREADPAHQHHGRPRQGRQGRHRPHLEEVNEMIDDGTISGGMLPKVECALDAVKNGVKTAHIIDGRISHACLLEVLTSAGVGTLIRGASPPIAQTIDSKAAGSAGVCARPGSSSRRSSSRTRRFLPLLQEAWGNGRASQAGLVQSGWDAGLHRSPRGRGASSAGRASAPGARSLGMEPGVLRGDPALASRPSADGHLSGLALYTLARCVARRLAIPPVLALICAALPRRLARGRAMGWYIAARVPELRHRARQ
jgi:acetylglutamate kinase